jgi:hypothetical protein
MQSRGKQRSFCCRCVPLAKVILRRCSSCYCFAALQSCVCCHNMRSVSVTCDRPCTPTPMYTQTARQSVMRVEHLLQSHESQESVSKLHAAVFEAKLSGDDDACVPVSSPSLARECTVALLPAPVTTLPSCLHAVTLSGARSEVACARASCIKFGNSNGAGIGSNFVHQWCPGRATVRFGRNSFDAGVLFELFWCFLKFCCGCDGVVESSCSGGWRF